MPMIDVYACAGTFGDKGRLILLGFLQIRAPAVLGTSEVIKWRVL